MNEKVRAHVIIRGRVQGVFFRMETKRAADQNRVSGWVRNLRDGSVEAEFSGEKADVDAVLRWCQRGPAMAQVTEVAIDWKGYREGEPQIFEVRY